MARWDYERCSRLIVWTGFPGAFKSAPERNASLEFPDLTA